MVVFLLVRTQTQLEQALGPDPSLLSDAQRQQMGESLFKATYFQFTAENVGFCTVMAYAGLVSAFGSYAASKTAKRFKLFHGFLAVGSVYLLSYWITYSLDPRWLAEYFQNVPERVKSGEPIATLVGAFLGGVLGFED